MKKQLLDSAPGIFAKKAEASEKDHEKELHELHAKIGQLTVERDFLARAYGMK